MKGLLQHILYGLTKKYAGVFTEADNNPDKWYELFITHEDGSTEPVARDGTFAGCFSHAGNYIRDYRFDRMNIDVWHDRDEPENGREFFSPPVLYGLIREYLTNTGAISKMAFYGSFKFNEIGRQCSFTPGHTANGYIFKDEILFTYFCDPTCYISEGEFENAGEGDIAGSTYNDILNIANGIPRYARNIFEHADRQHPATLWEDWNNNGVIDEGYLTGEESKQMLVFLLTENGNQLNYQVVDGDKYNCMGYHREGDKFIAFDNISGCCNVEEFELEEDAVKWLNHDYEEPGEFKGKTSLN